ncbi:hypothetical protein ACTFIY_006800 [Dictyostelium cf. discoideum]
MSIKDKSHKKESTSNTKKKLEEKPLPKTKKVEETSTTTIETKSKKLEKTKKEEENKKLEESIATPKTKKDKTKKETSTATTSTTTAQPKAKKVEETSATITKTTPKTKKVEETSTESKVKKAGKSKKVEEKKTTPPPPPPKENKTTTINKKQNEKVEQTKKPQQQKQQQQQQQQQQPQKRKLEEIESSSSESESEEDLGHVPDSSDDSDDDSDFDEIQADFDIVPSVDKDYHSIKNMIVRLVPYNETLKFNAGELTDLIIEQATKKKFGRSINIDGSEDPYGFISILNYQLVKNQPTIQGYIDYINEKLLEPEETFIDSKLTGGEKSMKSYLSKLLNQSKTNQLGLIFSERFINIPNQLAHPIYQFMQFDVELMQEKNNDKNYDFKNYLVFTSFGITSKPNEEDQLPPSSMNIDNNNNNNDDDSEDDEQPIKKSKSNKGTINKKENKSKNQKSKIAVQQQQQKEIEEVEEGLVLYQKCEDKYFREYASAWSTFDIPYLYGKGSKWTLYSNMIKKGLIMIIPASRYQQFLNDLKEKAIFD